MKIRSLPLLAILLLLFSSCVQIEPITVKSVQCCDIKKSHGSDPEISFQLEIENPNGFEIEINSYDLEVRINGNNIGDVKNTEQTVLAANSVELKAIRIKTSTQKLISGTLLMGLNALFKDDPTTLEIEIIGSVTGKAKGISKRVKIIEKYPLQMHP